MIHVKDKILILFIIDRIWEKDTLYRCGIADIFTRNLKEDRETWFNRVEHVLEWINMVGDYWVKVLFTQYILTSREKMWINK